VVWRKTHQLGVKFGRRLPENRRAVLEPVEDPAAAKRAVREALAAL
jgi:hypothetical protein